MFHFMVISHFLALWTAFRIYAAYLQKLVSPKARVEPSTGRGGKRGQTSGGKRGLKSAVRVRFAPKVVSQSTQRHTAREPAPQASSLASFVSNLSLATKRDAQKALKVARQLEAMAQEKLGTQQQVLSQTVNNARYQRTALAVEEPAHRHLSQRGTVRRSMQRVSPPEEPVHPLHDPSRYDHGYDEYVEDEMEEEDVKPNIAAMNQLRSRRSGY